MKHRNWMQHTYNVRMIVGIMLVVLVCFIGGNKVYAASEESKQALREELLEMLRTADSSVHDISAYNMTLKEVNLVWDDLVENEGYLEYHLYGGTCPLPDSYNGKYVKGMYVFGLDGDRSGFESRYANALQRIENVKNATIGMTDVEKVIYAHDYLVDNVYYKDDKGSYVSRAAGPLGMGYGICGGYADSMQVLLKYLGIDVFCQISDSMYHMWSYVKLDGEWYHLDATWDDTCSSSKGEVSHYFFIRNDEEFQSGLSKKYYGWDLYNTKETAPTSESTAYTDWFVHDIVGRMYYENGLWYYVDNKTGNIVRSKVDVEQSDYEIIIDREENNIKKLKVTGITDGVLSYTADGVAEEYFLDNIQISDDNIHGSRPLFGLSWNDAEYWRSGHYGLWNGVYQSYPGRICLQDYVPIESNQYYKVNLSNPAWRMLIREMTKDKKFITSHELKGDDIFEMGVNTEYIGVSIYIPSNTTISYEEYQKNIDSGMDIGLVQQEHLNVQGRTEWNHIGYWRSGNYSLGTGKYNSYSGRICLNDYVEINETGQYYVSSNDPIYHVLIRELGKNKNYIASHDIGEGKTIYLNQDTKYLAISLYNLHDSNLLYSDYREAFENGLSVIVKTSDTENVNVNETLNWNQDRYWQMGQYSMVTGLYERNHSRICLLDYVSISNDMEYQVVLPENSGCHMLIREMTENKSFISSYNLANGELYTPSENAYYIAISLYMPDNSNSVYDDYLPVIADGVGLNPIEKTPQTVLAEEILQEEELLEEMTEETEMESEEESESTTEETTEEEPESTEETTEEESESAVEETTEEESESAVEETTEEESESTAEKTTEEESESAVEETIEEQSESESEEQNMEETENALEEVVEEKAEDNRSE